ncbi:hypothetical protein [Rhodopirellula bahusiensis]|uniref:Uncharacterized protein n=1 Tax=Rhodopirellula bahusiensis TaxID=2014065 RepID=A0A2G1VY58_9BACT|nr:hypothetical protein [Rhodopirellula bahusiensis]PHQ31671.1 hypothetical protein CEE69_29730 [Rhodopirellula bahusiensis]
MSLSREEIFETSQRAAAVFSGISAIRRDSQIALWSIENDGDIFDAKESAAMGVSNFAFAIVLSDRLRDSLTPEALFFISETIQRSDLERPAVIPIEKSCCLEMAMPAVMQAWVAFQSLLSSEGGFELASDSWKDPRAFDELAEQIKQADEQSAIHVLQFLIESVDAVGYTSQDFDLLHGMAKREGAVVAAAIESPYPVGYPWGDVELAEDKFLWDNIQKGGNRMEILWENQKKSSISPKRMKQRVLRYAVFNKYENTRNFDGERPITAEQRQKELDAIRRVVRKKHSTPSPD